MKHTAVRSEVGLAAGLWGGSHYNGVGFLMTSLLRVEPRYYYNIDRRLARQKDIGNNSSNFFSLKTTWYPDWFVISNKNIDGVGGISIVPTYGFRRNINANFNYEISFGLGYQNKFSKNGNEPSLLPDVSARIGYIF